MKIYLLLIVLLFVCLQPSDSKKKSPKRLIVTIPELGKVRGKRIDTTWTGKRLYQFHDIKYGLPPSGARRFKPPLPALPWDDVKDATQPDRGCPSLQELDFIRQISNETDVEDCLTLTVNTRNLTDSYPVMVYLHGEFLYEGTSLEASPEYLLEKKIVLVAIRYRLAPFGFMSTMTDEIPGNAGVLDIILALEWIQKNIKYFGGDPNRVTLFGQVSGAAIANLLTMSPKVKENLFHRVIYQSASVLTPAFLTEDPVPFSKDIAKKANCTGSNENIDEVNKCLMQINATELLDAFSQHGSENAIKGIGHYGGLHFTIGGPSGVLPEHPAKLIQADKIRYYPTMGGTVKNAGSFILKEIYEDSFNETIPDDEYDAQGYIDFVISQTNGPDPTGAWKSYANNDFFNKEQLENGTFQSMIPGLIDLCGTIPFKNPVLLALQANAQKRPNETFLYSFNYEGQFNRYLEDSDLSLLPFDLGVSLTDENLYLFPWPEYAATLDKEDSRIARMMVSLWTSFAEKGIPKSRDIKKWPPMTGQNGPYLRIDRKVTIRKDFLEQYTVTIKEEIKGKTLVADDIQVDEIDSEKDTTDETKESEVSLKDNEA